MATMTPTRPVEVGSPTEIAIELQPISPYHHIAEILRRAEADGIKQVKGMLAKDGGYCAMGVLGRHLGEDYDVLAKCAAVEDEDLDHDILAELGMSEKLADEIMSLNDGSAEYEGLSRTFGQIADWLDSVDHRW